MKSLFMRLARLGALLGEPKLLAGSHKVTVLRLDQRLGGFQTAVELHHAGKEQSAQYQHEAQQPDDQIGVAQAFALKRELQLLGLVLQARDFEDARKVVGGVADLLPAHRVRQMDVFAVVRSRAAHVAHQPVDVAQLLHLRLPEVARLVPGGIGERFLHDAQRLVVLSRSLVIFGFQKAQARNVEPHRGIGAKLHLGGIDILPRLFEILDFQIIERRSLMERETLVGLFRIECTPLPESRERRIGQVESRAH